MSRDDRGVRSRSQDHSPEDGTAPIALMVAVRPGNPWRQRCCTRRRAGSSAPLRYRHALPRPIDGTSEGLADGAFRSTRALGAVPDLGSQLVGPCPPACVLLDQFARRPFSQRGGARRQIAPSTATRSTTWRRRLPARQSTVPLPPPSSTLAPMSEADDRSVRRPTATPDDDDRTWLKARLVEYRELLDYLRDH
jgi:hypothetical protein